MFITGYLINLPEHLVVLADHVPLAVQVICSGSGR